MIIRKEPRTDLYRPISLLLVLDKALEHIIATRIRADTDSRMSTKQYGFTKNRSTVKAIDYVLGWTENRTEKYVLRIFLDITGAFHRL